MSRGVSFLLLALLIAASNAAHAAPVPSAPPAAPPIATVPAPSPVALVNGEPIDGREFELILDTYLRQTREQMKLYKQKFGKAEERNVAANVLGGLINDRLWIQEARQSRMAVPDSAVDNRIKQDPFFRTDGKFDPAKWELFKTSPKSNYKDVFHRAHDVMIVDRLRTVLEKKFEPGEKKVYSEFQKQFQNHRVRTLRLMADPTLLEEQPSREQVEGYYQAHSSDFAIKEQLQCGFASFPLGTARDTSLEQSRAHAESLVLKARAAGKLDSVMAAAQGASYHETGWFEHGQVVPGLLNPASLSDSLFHLNDKEPYERAVMGSDGYGVLVVTGRKPSQIKPLKEVWSQAYSMARMELKQKRDEQESRHQYDQNPAHYRVHSAQVRALYFDPRLNRPQGTPTQAELQKFYESRMGSFFHVDTVGKPPRILSFAEVETTLVRLYPQAMADSLTIQQWNEAYRQAAAGKDIFSHPPKGVVACEFQRLTASVADTILTKATVDSILALKEGSVRHTFAAVPGRVVYRVGSVDTSYLPPYDDVKAKVMADVTEVHRKQKEEAAHAYYEKSPGSYMSDERYVIRFAGVPRPSLRELNMEDEASLKAWYSRHASKYSTPQQAHLQVMVFYLKPGATAADKKAVEAHIDSIRARVLAGEDFGTLASRYSEEPTSAKRGGDVGFLSPETLHDNNVSKVVMAMKAGEVSKALPVARGYYLFRCVEQKPAITPKLATIREQVSDDMWVDVGDSAAEKIAEHIMATVHTLDELQSYARRYGKGLRMSEPFQLNEPIPQLGDLQEIRDQLKTMKPGQIGRKPGKIFAASLIWMLEAKRPPEPLKFDKAKDLAIQRMDRDSMESRLRSRLDTLRVRLSGADNLNDVGYDLGKVYDSGPFARGGFIPGLGSSATIDTFLARARTGEISGIISMPQNQGGGYAVVQYLGPERLDQALYQRESKKIRDKLVQDQETAMLTSIRKRAKVRILRADLKNAWMPVPAGGSSASFQ